jgi:hypothetical protein
LNESTDRIHKPPHPGETLREDVLPAVGLTLKKVKPIGRAICGRSLRADQLNPGEPDAEH